MRLLHVEHPDGGGPGVFGDVAPLERWRAWEEPPPADADAYDALVLFGGATNVVDAAREPWLAAELDWLRDRVADGVPVLGVCLGGQLLAAALGADVTRSEPPEIGWLEVAVTEPDDPVVAALAGGDERFAACQWHSWRFSVPDGATLLASSAACPQAFRHGSAYGLQFHPEVDAPTLARWIDTYEGDPDAVAQGFDPARAPADAARELPAWSERGRRLFAAFLATAAR
jgi:GMP synthase-like glutamine amidotransferase